MSKHINIIARNNGVGLDSDVSLLTTAIEQDGHTVTFNHCRSRSILKRWIQSKPQYDINIFLERIFPAWFGTAKKNIFIPNQERFPHRHIKRLKKIDLVLCKSIHAQEIFSPLSTGTQYIGFTSKDILLNEVDTDYSTFFHLAGRSTLKGTSTILKLWEQHPEWPTLTILQHEENAPSSTPHNVNLITSYLSSDKLRELMNRSGIHLCPSRSEGWGHYIVEAMSTKAVVLTTNAPPMNELISKERGILTEYNSSEPRHLGTNYFICPQHLEQQIEQLIQQPVKQLETIGNTARTWFEQNNLAFKKNLQQVIQSL